jgi:hypothetical protein
MTTNISNSNIAIHIEHLRTLNPLAWIMLNIMSGLLALERIINGEQEEDQEVDKKNP